MVGTTNMHVVLQAHCRIANWNPDDFHAVATETAVIDIRSGERQADKTVVAKTQADDKLTLQAYGRPYKYGQSRDNKPRP